MRIVIVDDDDAFLRSLELVLQARGHDVRSFASSLRACLYLNGKPAVDALLVDYRMMSLSGVGLLHCVPADIRRRCRVIMMTGEQNALLADPEWDPRAVSGMLPKPIDIDQLESTLASSRGM
ncbi:MAG: response regulator [Phycisphaeraceae bacterium]|nr:response regulator [Phycisphaeraceae bacterium]